MHIGNCRGKCLHNGEAEKVGFGNSASAFSGTKKGSSMKLDVTLLFLLG